MCLQMLNWRFLNWRYLNKDRANLEAWVLKYSFFSHHHFIEHMVLINLISYIANVHSDLKWTEKRSYSSKISLVRLARVPW